MKSFEKKVFASIAVVLFTVCLMRMLRSPPPIHRSDVPANAILSAFSQHGIDSSGDNFHVFSSIQPASRTTGSTKHRALFGQCYKVIVRSFDNGFLSRLQYTFTGKYRTSLISFWTVVDTSGARAWAIQDTDFQGLRECLQEKPIPLKNEEDLKELIDALRDLRLAHGECEIEEVTRNEWRAIFRHKTIKHTLAIRVDDQGNVVSLQYP